MILNRIYAFIDTRTYIPSLIETLRELKNEKFIAEKYSYPEPSFSITNRPTLSERDKHFTFKGDFLTYTNLRFRNEFENQGIHVIPYDLNGIKIRMPYAKLMPTQIKKFMDIKTSNYKTNFVLLQLWIL